MNFKALTVSALALALAAPAPAQAFFWGKKKIDLGQAVNSIQERVLALDCGENKTTACSEKRVVGLQKIAKEVNKLFKNAEVSSLRIEISDLKRNEDGTYRVNGTIVEDRAAENESVGRGLALVMGIFSLEAAKEVWQSATEIGELEHFIAYDSSFANSKFSASITVDKVSFDSLENIDEGEVITLKNITGFYGTGKFAQCGLLDLNCSSFTKNRVSIDAKKAKGYSFFNSKAS